VVVSRAAVIVALALAACSKGAPCGAGTHDADGQCVLDDWVRNAAEGRVRRGAMTERLAQQLEMLNVLKNAEALAAEPEAIEALDAADADARQHQARIAFARFKVDATDDLPDVLALVDAGGNIIAMDGVSNPMAKQWSKPDGSPMIPSLDVVLAHAGDVTSMSEPYLMERIPMRVGVAAIVGPDGTVRGAIVLGYAITAVELRKAAALTGSDVALVEGGQVVASSPEDAKAAADLAAAVRGARLLEMNPTPVSMGGQAAEAIAVPLPRFANRKQPPNLPPITAQIVVVGRTLGASAPAAH
jgi:hypothetical protein